MDDRLASVGKVSAKIFDEVILPRLGGPSRDVLVGPQVGVDVGIVSLGNGQVLVATTDPLYVLPELGWEKAGWFAIQILASDAATSGLAPNYITIDLNLPTSFPHDDLEVMWTAMHRACKDLGIAIITGHTGHYEGCSFPMIGGATVFCVGPEDRYVIPSMARPGDKVIITKGAAIETAGTLATVFRDRVAAACGDAFAEEASKLFWQMTVVKDAMTAVSVGVREDGVTSMHDATEGGVWGALVEVARASSVGMRIDKQAILVPEVVRKTCELFGIDPYPASSEGTLIITCKAEKADAVIARLSDEGIASSIVGEVLPLKEGLSYVEGGAMRSLEAPAQDPFWPAYRRAAAEVQR